VTFELDCTGTWSGAYTNCDPNPCPQPGACCFVDGTCEVVLEEECLAALGDWYGDTDPDCEPSPCPPPTPVERKSWGQIKSRYR
jgi:hypothetical protein